MGARGGGMHLDFLLAQAATAEPRLALEPDDRSHARPEAEERDADKETPRACRCGAWRSWAVTAWPS
jgi:hypothetical protein